MERRNTLCLKRLEPEVARHHHVRNRALLRVRIPASQPSSSDSGFSAWRSQSHHALAQRVGRRVPHHAEDFNHLTFCSALRAHVPPSCAPGRIDTVFANVSADSDRAALTPHCAFRPLQQFVQFSAIEERAIQHDCVNAADIPDVIEWIRVQNHQVRVSALGDDAIVA